MAQNDQPKNRSSVNEIVVSLDIGTTKICAIVGRKNENGKIDILGMGKTPSEGVMRGVVANIDQTISAIKEAIDQASEKSNVHIRNVQVGIAGQHIRSSQHSTTIVKSDDDDVIAHHDVERLRQDIKKVVTAPGEQIIHVIPQEYTIDNERGIVDPIGHSGIRLEGNFHIITARVSSARNIIRCVNRADLNVESLVLEPIASSEAVLVDDEKEAGVALVDIGGGTTDIAIFKDGIIRHTAVLPLGGNTITNDIKSGCSVMKKQAEAMKIKFGSALANEAKANEIITIPGLKGREPKEISVRNLAHIIQARTEEIFEHVLFEIKSSGYEKDLIAGIVVTGGGSQLKHLTQLVEYVTGIDARIGLPNEHLSRAMVDDVKSPMYATGIGLLMHGYKQIETSNRPLADHKNEEDTESKEKPNKGWFKDIITKGKSWLNEDVDDFQNS